MAPSLTQGRASVEAGAFCASFTFRGYQGRMLLRIEFGLLVFTSAVGALASLGALLPG